MKNNNYKKRPPLLSLSGRAPRLFLKRRNLLYLYYISRFGNCQGDNLLRGKYDKT
jgi:hypothetical protein